MFNFWIEVNQETNDFSHAGAPLLMCLGSHGQKSNEIKWPLTKLFKSNSLNNLAYIVIHYLTYLANKQKLTNITFFYFHLPCVFGKLHFWHTAFTAGGLWAFIHLNSLPLECKSYSFIFKVIAWEGRVCFFPFLFVLYVSEVFNHLLPCILASLLLFS